MAALPLPVSLSPTSALAACSPELWSSVSFSVLFLWILLLLLRPGFLLPFLTELFLFPATTWFSELIVRAAVEAAECFSLSSLEYVAGAVKIWKCGRRAFGLRCSPSPLHRVPVMDKGLSLLVASTVLLQLILQISP